MFGRAVGAWAGHTGPQGGFHSSWPRPCWLPSGQVAPPTRAQAGGPVAGTLVPRGAAGKRAAPTRWHGTRRSWCFWCSAVPLPPVTNAQTLEPASRAKPSRVSPAAPKQSSPCSAPAAFPPHRFRRHRYADERLNELVHLRRVHTRLLQFLSYRHLIGRCYCWQAAKL